MPAAMHNFFDAQSFMPHGHCYLWRVDILWLHIFSDTLISCAYFIIPLALVQLVKKRSDLAFNWLFLLFASFIVACGVTHLLSVWTIWNPDYAAEGLVKLLTGLSSMATAIALWHFLPKIIQLPGVNEYKKICERLEQEIVHRENAQGELERRENQLHLIINQLPVAIAYLTKDMHFQYCNATYARWQNKSKEEIIGRHAKDIIPGLVFQQTASYLQRALAGETVRATREHVAFHDHERDVALQDIPDMDGQGQVNGVIRMLTDISEQRQIERELKRAKDIADASNLAKSAFVANISHEIRTPLGAVLGFSDMLARDGLPPADRNQYTSAIRRNSDLLLHIIDDILDISKMEVGKIILNEQEVDLHEILSDACRFLQLQALKKGLNLRMSAEKPLPQYIRTDPYRLKQILINLLSNAIKFSDQGTVELKVESRPEPGKPGQLAFSVRDEGIGMSEVARTHLFEPFFQADPSATRRYGGTGLGLSLSKRFAEMLGGNLQLIQSESGKGSVFLLTIQPQEARGSFDDAEASTAEDHAGSTSAPSADVLKNLKILLVEDAPDNQFLISTYLTAAGAEVEMVDNGKLALDRLAQNAIDVVLMDLQMPVMSGFEAVAELRKQGRQLPIIALTAHAKPDDKQRCLDAGFNGHIGKPINRGELIEKIAQSLASTP